MFSSIQQMSTAAFTEPSMDLSFIVRFPRTAILSPVPAILLTEAGVDATDDFNTYVFLRHIKAGDEVSVESIRSLKKQGLWDEAFRKGWLVEEVEASRDKKETKPKKAKKAPEEEDVKALPDKKETKPKKAKK